MEKENEKRYVGIFNILGEEISGELIHNKQTGVIMLNLAKKLSESTFFGKSYAPIKVISGQINTGATVTIYNNKCINNHTHAGQVQRLCFICEYLIWSRELQMNTCYNELVCTLKNAFAWSKLSVFETNDKGIKLKEESDKREFNWFGVKVKFSVFSNETFWLPLESEEKTIIQRVVLSISSEEKLPIEELVSIRDKILSMISFAIRNNINIDEEYLLDYEDSYMVGDKIKQYHHHYLLTNYKELETYDLEPWDFTFTLNQLSENKDINKELEKLGPVFNLYLSLFKYRDMPIEMIFLNIVQALETFHSRFFYDNKKKKYVESVMKRFSESEIFDSIIKEKLLSDTQMDENCSYIILVSRLNDLFIGNYNNLFYEYWGEEDNYAQIIADTRHYYTHYGSSKEKKH